MSLPEEYGGWGLSELEVLKCQEEFSRGPGGMRMHMHFAQDLIWRSWLLYRAKAKESCVPFVSPKASEENRAAVSIKRSTILLR